MDLSLPAPLTDGVVVLRLLQPSDADAVYDACQDPEIARWTQIPQPYTRDDAAWFTGSAMNRFATGAEAPFAVADARDGAFLASLGLPRIDVADRIGEVGYWVAPSARGRGVATRGVRLLAPWAFEQGLERLELLADVDNAASQRVAEKAGFRREGVLRAGRKRRDGTRSDLVMFSLLPKDASFSQDVPLSEEG